MSPIFPYQTLIDTIQKPQAKINERVSPSILEDSLWQNGIESSAEDSSREMNHEAMIRVKTELLSRKCLPALTRMKCPSFSWKKNQKPKQRFNWKKMKKQGRNVCQKIGMRLSLTCQEGKMEVRNSVGWLVEKEANVKKDGKRERDRTRKKTQARNKSATKTQEKKKEKRKPK